MKTKLNQDTQRNNPTFIQCLIGALMFDKQIYKQFNDNAEFILRALATVSTTGISMAVTMKYTIKQTGPGDQFLDLQMMAVAFSTVLVGWMMWAFITKVICQIMGGASEFRNKMRSIGITYVPGPLIILAVIPVLGEFILFFVWLWVLASATRSIQVTEQIHPLKALAISLVGWFLSWILLPVLMLGNYFYSQSPNP